MKPKSIIQLWFKAAGMLILVVGIAICVGAEPSYAEAVLYGGQSQSGEADHTVGKYVGGDSSWTDISPVDFYSVFSLTTDTSNNLYAGGQATSTTGKVGKYSYTDPTWQWATDMPSPTGFKAVNILTTDSLGNLYAGGHYEDGGYYYGIISKYSGGSWGDVGSGFGALDPTRGAIRDFAVSSDGDILYAAGKDTSENYPQISMYDGTWSPIDPDGFFSVDSLVTNSSGTLLYAGGVGESGDTGLVSIYNGLGWSNINMDGAGFSIVYSLAIDPSTESLYAGGTDADGNAIVSKYTLGSGPGGTDWTAIAGLPGNAEGIIYSLIADSDGLIVGGSEIVSGTSYDRVSKYVYGAGWIYIPTPGEYSSLDMSALSGTNLIGPLGPIGAVPEPATVAGFLGAMIAFGIRKLNSGKQRG